MDDRVANFNRAVEAFLAKKGPENIASLPDKMLEDFLIEPSISAYLTRPANDVKFDEKGEPVLESPYEAAYYEKLRQSCTLDDSPADLRRKSIPYRAEIYNNTWNHKDGEAAGFYTGGTSENAKTAQARTIQRKLDEYAQTATDPSTHVFLMPNLSRIEDINSLLNPSPREDEEYDYMDWVTENGLGRHVELPQDGISFLIMPGGTDDHAYTLFAVIDNAAKKIIRTGLCNSSQNDNYALIIRDSINDVLGQGDPIHYQPYPPDHAAVANLPSFVDCSHHLQTHETDRNCGLYRHYFSRALVEMLEKDEHIRSIMADPNATDRQVSEAVREGMKPYLPEYYHKTAGGFVEASEEEKRQTHLETRWAVGNAFLQDRIAEIKRQRSGMNRGAEC